MVRAAVGRSAEFYFRQGLAASTARRYEGAWKKYANLCSKLEVDPLPVSEDKAVAYVVTLAGEGLQAATVKYHLAGLRQVQIKAGLSAPVWGAMARLSQIRVGIARYRVVQGDKKLERNPVTPVHMNVMLATWRKAGDRGTMLWAAACTCFFGCLRAGEALVSEGMDFDPKAHLSFDDVSVDSLERPRVIRVRIKESKTDRFRKGATVALCWTGGCMCPVKAILAFMVVRKAGPGPFFKLPAGKPLTRKSFVAEVRAALAKAGMAC